MLVLPPPSFLCPPQLYKETFTSYFMMTCKKIHTCMSFVMDFKALDTPKNPDGHCIHFVALDMSPFVANEENIEST